MNRDQFGIDIGKKRRDIVEELARDIFGSRRHIAKGRIVFVQELVVESIVDFFAGAAFDLADVDQHSRNRVDASAENKIGNIVATGSMPGTGLLAERS